MDSNTNTLGGNTAYKIVYKFSREASYRFSRIEVLTRKLDRCRNERYCPDKWKKTKPKNDKLSFSKSEDGQPGIAVTHMGKSVIMNETSSNTQAYPISSDGVNNPHDQSGQNEIGIDDNNEAQITATNEAN